MMMGQQPMMDSRNTMQPYQQPMNMMGVPPQQPANMGFQRQMTITAAPQQPAQNMMMMGYGNGQQPPQMMQMQQPYGLANANGAQMNMNMNMQQPSQPGNNINYGYQPF